MFLDASDDTLVRRFEEARRPHPLQKDGTLFEGIARERELLGAVRERADTVIDTSYTQRSRVARPDRGRSGGGEFTAHRQRRHLWLQATALPRDADFVADVRFLHNPHWVPALRPLTGLDPAVRDYVLASEGAQGVRRWLRGRCSRTC